ncbi:MAG: PIN domain-containing protein [Candidatus Bathyarchaeia archaeon]
MAGHDLQKSKRFFYDSYAVLAYLSDNPNYRVFFEEDDGILTKLNLMEIYYRTLEVHGVQAASEVVKAFAKYATDFGVADIEGAMKLRLKLKKIGHDISYADAMGYYLAKKSNIKFLTGDKWFKDLEGVEFVN